MKKIFLAILVSALLFACNQSTETATTDTDVVADTTLNNAATNTTDLPMQQAVTTDSNTLINTVATSAPQPQAITTTAKGMNPPHGEPGHRCDIAVGAPLNSAPAAKTPAATTPSSTPVINPVITPPANMTAPATPVTAAPGMNPPHGEPGHDCKIAVGAPLKK